MGGGEKRRLEGSEAVRTLLFHPSYFIYHTTYLYTLVGNTNYSNRSISIRFTVISKWVLFINAIKLAALRGCKPGDIVEYN